MIAELLFILALTVVNGLFAMAEIAIVSARKARLQQRAEEGDERAARALALASSPEGFLSTIQVGITLVTIVAGVYGGATIAETLARLFATVSWLAPYAAALALGTVVLGVTFLSLVVGELVPKRIALAYPESIAGAVARPLELLQRAATPVVWLLSRASELVIWLMRIRPPKESPVTEEEIKIMLEQGTQAGVIQEAEQDIVERVFRLGDRRVSALMTPRTDVVWIDIDDPIGDSMRTMINGGHTYYPVCRGSIDHIIGMASVKEQWARMVNRQPPDLRNGLQPPLYIPETMPVFQALETFKKAGRHVAVVIDEYGSICGLVTLNDVLGALVGDVPTSDNPDDMSAVQREDGSWLLDGSLPADELKRILEVDELPGEDRGEFQTLGGFLMLHLGRIPRPTDHFDWDGHRFEVMDMDGHRVDKVLVIPSRRPADSASAGADATPG